MEVQEISRNKKNRGIKNVENLYKGKKYFKNIISFSIFIAENPNGEKDIDHNNRVHRKELSSWLKVNHYVWVPVRGKYGVTEHSVLVFNISLENTKNIAKRFNQESFFFCYPEGSRVQNEYWEFEAGEYCFVNKTQKIITTGFGDNDYTVVGNHFKFSIDPEVFRKVDSTLGECYNSVWIENNFATDSPRQLIEYAYSKVGMKASAILKSVQEIFDARYVG